MLNTQPSTALYFYIKNDLTFSTSGTRLSAGFRTQDIKKAEGSTVSSLSDRLNAWDLGVSQAILQNFTVSASYMHSKAVMTSSL